MPAVGIGHLLALLGVDGVDELESRVVSMAESSLIVGVLDLVEEGDEIGFRLRSGCSVTLLCLCSRRPCVLRVPRTSSLLIWRVSRRLSNLVRSSNTAVLDLLVLDDLPEVDSSSNSERDPLLALVSYAVDEPVLYDPLPPPRPAARRPRAESSHLDE